MKQRCTKQIVSLIMIFAMLLSYLPGTVWAVDPATDIKAIEKPTGWVIVEDYDDYFGDNWVKELELPATVKVTLANNSVTNAPVAWDTSVLDTRTPGYYSVPGDVTLPADATNGQNLKVSITIQVKEKDNLIINPSFEKNLNGWYLRGANPLPSRVEGIAADGNFSAIPGKWSDTNPNVSIANTKNMITEVSAAVAATGAGQYYYGVQVKSAAQTLPDGVTIVSRLYCNPDANTSGKTFNTTRAPLSNTAFNEYGMVVNISEGTGYVRMDVILGGKSGADISGMSIYVDDAKLIPLKVALKSEPSAIEEIKTEILSRAVVLNYPDYVGEDWKSALGLPTSVQVLTDRGTLADVDVTWSYAGLDFTKYGKYTLTGKLEDSGFPNPKGLTVQQDIYITKAKNLIPNPSFENDTLGWQLRGTDFGRVTSPVKDGIYAGTNGKWVPDKTNVYLADTRNMAEEVGAAVALQGAGQYYYSMWSQVDVKTIPANMQMQTWVYYQTIDDNGVLSSSIIVKGDKVPVSNKEYVQSAGIMDMPKNVAKAQLNMYYFVEKIEDFEGVNGYFDQAELIALNVPIPKGQEPTEITEILSELPVRAVVQNYDKYVGANWQSAMGLPAQVKVRTSGGNDVMVDVSWDFETLNIGKVGKYVLVGTLDNSTYPNPKELYVTQTIYIREYKNLIPNPSLESGTTGWKLRGTGAGRVTSPVKDGKYAGASGTWVPDKTNVYLGDTREMADQVGTAIAMQGAGQYYYSMWSQVNAKTIPADMQMQTWVYYQTIDDNGVLSSSIIVKGDKVPVSNQEYVQSAGIMDFPKNVAKAQLNMYYFVKDISDFDGVGGYFDQAELVPLNIIIERYEGELEEVETVIPQRKIIQNYQNYIGGAITTADLQLPEYVQVRTTTGQVVSIAVKWDISKLDLTKIGTYKIPGTLEEMRLDNPKGFAVEQVIHVVAYKNLLINPSFEDYGDNWKMSSKAKSELGLTSPVKHGNLSMQIILERLDPAQTSENFQAMVNEGAYDLGLRVAATGAGQYYFGGWAQAEPDAADLRFYTRLWYRCYDNGDSSSSVMGPVTTPSTKEYLSSDGIVTLPGDVYWARLDMYLYGTISQLSFSHMNVDHMELIPLNVEVPNMNDVVDCEEVANVFAHQGTRFEDLGLPETLEVVTKNGQRFQIGVTWDKTAYDPNKLGQQTITAELNLGTKYKNTKNFVPSTVITIRAKGEDLRQTIYISTSGNEANDGLSPSMPKKDITKIPEYLAQGYNVRLKKGDTWYLPIEGFTFKNLYGTEKAPLTVTSYGEGARPIIGFMMKIENNAWRLVDEKRNVYAADVAALGQYGGESVHRCFVQDEAYFHKSRNNYVSLGEKEYCSYNDTLYIRMPAGEVPKGVEVTPNGHGNVRINIQNVSYLTFEDLHFKGGSARFSVIEMNAPTKFVKFTKSDITHNWCHIAELEANDERIHYKPEFSYLFTDTMISEREGEVSSFYETYWDPHSLEGITMRDGVEGAWIHHNVIRQVAHCFVAIESLDAAEETKTRGVYDCITEDNIFEAGNAKYARCMTFSANFNLSGTQMCRDNTFRRNRAYGMTVANHFFGENNIAYSNMFTYVHTAYNEDGETYGGKGAKSFAFNTDPWGGKNCTGNMVINNTFYDVTGVAFVYDQGGAVYNNLYANNLVVNWKSEAGQDDNATGAYYINAIDLNYFMHNGFYSYFGEIDHFVVNQQMYSAEDANKSLAGFKGNMSADPKFVNVDMSLLGADVRQEFVLSGESPMRYAGLSLYDPVFESFPAWERLKADYTDINGVVYLAESPSIGAYSFCELITGNVAQVGELEDVLCRPGANINQLMLPDCVPAVNDQGIDVVLLVTWNTEGVDTSKPGTITLTGELRNGPHTDLNINGKTASIKINVKDKLELMNIVTRVDTLTVLYGTTFDGAIAQLPNKLHVVEESGFEEDLPVTWTCMDYDGNKPGDYTFKCVLPEDMLSNTREFDLEVIVRVMHELGRGVELLINPDFIDGGSASPWKLGWLSGQYGNFRVTTDPELLPEGEPGGAIVTVSRRYASIQQDVVGQMKLMGDGKYLLRVKMRAYEITEPIDSSYACLQQVSASTITHRSRVKSNIGTEYVEFYQIFDIDDVMNAQAMTFHTSTGKSLNDAEDGPRSYIIAGCSFIFLGTTDAEVEATLDSLDLTWNAIKGENGYDQGNVMSDLKLPTKIGEASTIKWTSSDESVITNDGKVTMGRVPKTVTMTATITYKGKETVKKFMVTVPRSPDLPIFSGSLTGSQKAQVGDEVSVTIKLNAENATTFNAYRFTLSYNVTRLEYVGISDPTSTVELDGGRVIISGIGAERPITDTITVTFKVLKSGVTEVKLVKVEMDIDPKASLDNLPTMTVTNGAASIDVEKSENDKQDSGKPTVESGKKDDSAVLWIVIGLVAAALIAGGVIAIILIKKKKQLPPATEE